ncbi:hypothetical protein M3Y95_00459100 [Aphelenchoides besseyi]|nr:hypothetical protein M3Y95_00459100 [Aphelenchoides besseyi]
MKVLEDKFKAVMKVQYVDSLPKLFKGKEMTVSDCLNKVSACDNLETVIDQLDNCSRTNDGLRSLRTKCCKPSITHFNGIFMSCFF